MGSPDLSQYRSLFFSESGELLGGFGQQLLALEKNPRDPAIIQELFRIAHTLKGMSATMGFDAIRDFTHQLENSLDQLRSGDISATPVIVTALLHGADTLQDLVASAKMDPPSSVDTARILAELQHAFHAATPLGSGAPTDAPAGASRVSGPSGPARGEGPTDLRDHGALAVAKLARGRPAPPPSPVEGAAMPTPGPMHAAGGSQGATSLRVSLALLDELMNLAGELMITKTRLQQLATASRQDPLERAVNTLHKTASSLQEKILATRIVPAKELFGRFPRIVRDLAQREGHEVTLHTAGEDIGLDRALLDALVEPLTHLITNAVIHGLESPGVRAERHKPPSGSVTLSASRERGFITLTVRDDGQGMDPAVLRAKAVELRLMSRDAVDRLSDREALMLITLPGLSTASTVTTGAGRGVGMDVVRNKIQALRGTLAIDSTVGTGTSMTLRLPFTLTILQALLVKASDEIFCLPFLSVHEILTHAANGHATLAHHGESIPIVSLASLLDLPQPTSPHPGPYAIIEAGNRRVAMAVDAFLAQQEIVVKPLPPPLTMLKPYGGATILGDGRVSLILDVNALLS